jgi:uncharacterized tellurite resistance protein B-like protein
MLDVLRSLFAASAPASQPPEPRLAAAALLVEAARADGTYAGDERAAIDRFLAHAFGLDPVAASEARAEGERAQAEAADLVRFTRVLKHGLDHAARMRLMTALWRVVLSDGQRDPHEDALLRKLAPLLALTDHDSAEARRLAADPW